MPFKWDADAERKMLLYVKHCDVKPGTDTFNGVANVLGEGVNVNACTLVVYVQDVVLPHSRAYCLETTRRSANSLRRIARNSTS